MNKNKFIFLLIFTMWMEQQFVIAQSEGQVTAIQIQDIGVVAALFGTDLNSRHVIAITRNGWQHITGACCSYFGSLGLAKGACLMCLSSTSLKRLRYKNQETLIGRTTMKGFELEQWFTDGIYDGNIISIDIAVNYVILQHAYTWYLAALLNVVLFNCTTLATMPELYSMGLIWVLLIRCCINILLSIE